MMLLNRMIPFRLLTVDPSKGKTCRFLRVVIGFERETVRERDRERAPGGEKPSLGFHVIADQSKRRICGAGEVWIVLRGLCGWDDRAGWINPDEVYE